MDSRPTIKTTTDPLQRNGEKMQGKMNLKDLKHSPNLPSHLTTHHIGGNIKVGVTELQGQRPTQEDCTLVQPLADFDRLTEMQRKMVLLETIEKVQSQKEIKEMETSCGSTLLSTVICGNEIYTTNLGDSLSYLCIVHGDQVTLERLNKKLHNAPDEIERLVNEDFIKTNAQIETIEIDKRLGGALGLSPSRAIGDPQFENVGLSHFPDITTRTIQPSELPPGARAFIINGCDGLLEGRKDDAFIKSILQEKVKSAASVTDLSLALAKEAHKTSKDNISTMVVEITPFIKKIDETRKKEKMEERTPPPAICLAVFDGHGGDTVSNLLGKQYGAVLQESIHNASLQRLSKPKQEKDEIMVNLEAWKKTLDAAVALIKAPHREQAQSDMAVIHSIIDHSKPVISKDLLDLLGQQITNEKGEFCQHLKLARHILEIFTLKNTNWDSDFEKNLLSLFNDLFQLNKLNLSKRHEMGWSDENIEKIFNDLKQLLQDQNSDPKKAIERLKSECSQAITKLTKSEIATAITIEKFINEMANPSQASHHGFFSNSSSPSSISNARHVSTAEQSPSSALQKELTSELKRLQRNPLSSSRDGLLNGMLEKIKSLTTFNPSAIQNYATYKQNQSAIDDLQNKLIKLHKSTMHSSISTPLSLSVPEPYQPISPKKR